MSKYLTLLFLLASLLAAGADQETDKSTQASAPEAKRADSVISLHEILENRDKFKGLKVTIAAYFVTHFEGSWICAENGDWEKRLETTLSIKKVGAAKFKVLDSTRVSVAKKFGFDKKEKPAPVGIFEKFTLYHSQFNDGTPALITGNFQVGNYSYPNGVNLKDEPFMELIEIREVKADDPQWKAAQTKGEQDSARQPTTAPDSKSEGKEKPKPESEGRSQ